MATIIFAKKGYMVILTLINILLVFAHLKFAKLFFCKTDKGSLYNKWLGGVALHEYMFVLV